MSDELADKQFLYELMCRYCNAVDRKQFERLRPLYQQTALHDHGDMFQGGPEAFIAFLQQNMQAMTTQHLIGNHFYCIVGDRAEGEIYTVNYHILHKPEGDEEYVAGGRYIDHYVREGDQWRISFRKRIIDWRRQNTLKDLAHYPQAQVAIDPAHGLLPNLYPSQK